MDSVTIFGAELEHMHGIQHMHDATEHSWVISALKEYCGSLELEGFELKEL